MTKKAVVIGSGIGGLAAAIRLAAKNYTVEVFEANDRPGGKIKELRSNGYRFDMGPSVFTMPHLIDELFEIHGKDPRDYFSYSKLEKPFKYFFGDGTSIDSFADVEKFADEIGQKTLDSKSAFTKYLRINKKKYSITRPVFIESSIHRLKDWLNWDFLKGILQFHKIEAFKSMDRANSIHFKDERLRTLFNNYATYVGSNPFVAPATLNVIPHIEITKGLYLPEKGIFSIMEALVKLAGEIGIQIHYKSEVEEIEVLNGKASGVKVNGQTISSGIVISNMDIHFTYNKLMPTLRRPERILGQEKSSSVIAFYWGINGEHPELQLHNMLFTEDQEKEFEAIFRDGEISDDPSLYICITSKKIIEDAPAGKENWFVLITAPNNSGQDWDDLVKKARRSAISKIKRTLNKDIEEQIEFEECLSPIKIEQNYRSAFGSVYGNSSNSKWAAFLRHANFSKRIRNLYFVGGSVHPGAGIPMCLNSAKIMSQMID